MTYPPLLHDLLVGFTSVSFFLYGSTCLFTDYMRVEFARYGLSKYRVITGALQLAAAAALALSFVQPILGTFAAAGLAAQMALGFAVRLKIRDGFWRSSPAFIYMVLSLLILPGF